MSRRLWTAQVILGEDLACGFQLNASFCGWLRSLYSSASRARLPTHLIAAFRGRRILSGQAVLQTGVAELVDRPNSPQDVPLVGVFQESHQMEWGPIGPGELCESKSR